MLLNFVAIGWERNRVEAGILAAQRGCALPSGSRGVMMSCVQRANLDRADGIDSPDGVDVTLIRWMLSLTPEERLRVLQEHQAALADIQAVRERGPQWTSEPS